MADMFEGGEAPRRDVLPLVPKTPKRATVRTVGRMISVKPVKSNVVFSVLKAAWGSYGSVVMIELKEGFMAFDFESEVDRDRVMDMSPWAIHRHYLNLKLCYPNQSMDEVDFGKLQLWAQVHGPSAEMLNSVNATNIAARIGKNLLIENEKEMHVRGYMRMKLEIDVTEPVYPGFWWTNYRGVEKWAQIKYERMSDFCFGCDRLGHTAQNCNLEIVPSEVNGRLPMYGPWISCPRQRKLSSWHKPGVEVVSSKVKRDPARKTWQEMMKEGSAVMSNVGEGVVNPKLDTEATTLSLIPQSDQVVDQLQRGGS